MLRFGRIQTRDRTTRRELLQAGTLSAVGLTLGDLLRAEALQAKEARGAEPQVRKAKSVILLWLWGGPSHLDTFDMKPLAPVEYRGPYQPVRTSVPGIDICELLPNLAKQADKYAIVRSMCCNSNDHGIAGTIGLTGSDAGAISLSGQTVLGQIHPAHGSIAARVALDDGQKSDQRAGVSTGLPRFLALGGRLHQGHRGIAGEGGGPLGAMYDPFRLEYHPDRGAEVPQLQLLDGVTASGLDARQKLRARFDDLANRLETSVGTHRLDSFYQQAFSLLTSGPARDVFDLSKEPEPVRRRFGKFRFGQCCLMARRLVEAGARFVQVNWSSHVEPVEDTGDGGWDMHDRNFQQFQDRHAWMLDSSVSALLHDLHERGLLEETVVVALGEFGRTPRINVKAGRDHWNQCYSALIAGGGIRPGQIIGSSDPLGEHPLTRPVSPADLFATVLKQIGIGTTELTSNGLFPLGSAIEELS